MSQEFWLGVATGTVVTIFVLSLVVPNRWATWLVTRSNLPTVLMPFGVLLLSLAVINLVYGLGWAILRALGLVQIATWVWLALAAGVLILAIYIGVRRALRQPVHQPAQPVQNP